MAHVQRTDRVTGRVNSRVRHGFALVALLGVGVAAFGVGLQVRPFARDNLASLGLGSASPVELLTRPYVSAAPGYRPIPHFLVGLEQSWLGLSAQHFLAVNIALWIACAVAIYGVVWVVSGSKIGGLAAGSLFLVDVRIQPGIYWISERQSVLACLFGALALLVAYRVEQRRGGVALPALAVGVLLLASALSKEYGLAFAAGVGILALEAKGVRRALLLSSFGAVGTYLLMRVVLAGGAAVPYCEDAGFFLAARLYCYGPVGPADVAPIAQAAWNVAATAIGTFFPELFTKVGALHPLSTKGGVSADMALESGSVTAAVWVFFAAVFALCLVAWLRVPRQALPLLGVIAGNAVLSFLIYRTRNHMVANVGLYATCGLGIAQLGALVGRARQTRWKAISVAALAVLALWVGWQATLQSEAIEQYRKEAATLDPCSNLDERGRITLAVVREVKRHYRLPNPDCRGFTIIDATGKPHRL